MKIKWYEFGKRKPKVSGFYLVKRYNIVDILYYNTCLDRWLYFEYGYEYLCMLPGYNNNSLQWAKLTDIPKSKLINNGYLELEF